GGFSIVFAGIFDTFRRRPYNSTFSVGRLRTFAERQVEGGGMVSRDNDSPGRLDAFRLARERRAVEGSVDPHRLARLADLLAVGPLTLVEDELVLALPFAPRHPDDGCDST